MEHRHAICLVVDGLRASALGAYGNTHFATPQLDSLASKSSVADWLLADMPTLSGFYRAAWEGRHALRPVLKTPGESALDRLTRQQVSATLLTDEPWLAAKAEDYSFEDVVLHEQEDVSTAGILATALESYFASTIDQLQDWKLSSTRDRGLLWCHCRGMYGPWDAPAEMRETLLDEDDPPAGNFVEPPSNLDCVEDPDTLLSYRVAYAAQVMLLDQCIGAFTTAVEELFHDSELLLMVLGSRGFALGEHGALGTERTELYSECLHLPWLAYQCGNSVPQQRLRALSQPADIGACLEAWFGADLKADSSQDGLPTLLQRQLSGDHQRTLSVAMGEQGERMVRTPAWQWISSESTIQGPSKLFTKPDDRWECNDIGSLCPDIVEQLREELTRYEQFCENGDPLPLSTCSDDLSLHKR